MIPDKEIVQNVLQSIREQEDRAYYGQYTVAMEIPDSVMAAVKRVYAPYIREWDTGTDMSKLHTFMGYDLYKAPGGWVLFVPPRALIL